MDYKLSIYGNKINKDVFITEDMDTLSLGTYKECQIYFKRNKFYSDYKIEISRQGDNFIASCDGEVYFVSRQNPNIKDIRLENFMATKLPSAFKKMLLL